MEKHAKFSPSSLHRTLACAGAYQAELEFPDPEPSEFAKEGTLAHELAADIALNKPVSTKGVPEEMLDYVIEYCKHLYELKSQSQAKQYIETKVEITDYVWGTADAITVTDKHMWVTDLKYGQGVKVKAEGNPQLAAYALGAYQKFRIAPITVQIYQPRTEGDPLSEVTYSKKELAKWLRAINKGIKLALEPKPPRTAGEHCRFCKAKAVCPELQQLALTSAGEDFAKPVPPEQLSHDQIVNVLNHAGIFKDWVKSVEEYARSKALDGYKWKDYKLVEGRTRRAWRTDLYVSNEIMLLGIEDPYEEKLKSPAAVEREIGKGKIDHLTVKPKGAPTLVHVSDKRKELSRDAASDFLEE